MRMARLLARRPLGWLLRSRTWARTLARVHRGLVPLPVAVRTIADLSRVAGVPPLLSVSVGLVETGLRGAGGPGPPWLGWFQMRVDAPPYPTIDRPPTPEEAHDLEFATTEFCRAAAALAEDYPGLRRDLWLWAIFTQGVGDDLDRALAYRPENFAGYLHEAAGLLRAFDVRPATATRPDSAP